MDLRLCLCLALLGTAVLVTLTTASEYFPTEPAEAATVGERVIVWLTVFSHDWQTNMFIAFLFM